MATAMANDLDLYCIPFASAYFLLASVGCVVLELATGKKPWYSAENEWQIMYQCVLVFIAGVCITRHPPLANHRYRYLRVLGRIGAGELPPLPEPGQLSEAGVDFILCCLTINSEERPTSSELLEHHPWMTSWIQFRNTMGDSYDDLGDTGYDDTAAYTYTTGEETFEEAYENDVSYSLDRLVRAIGRLTDPDGRPYCVLSLLLLSFFDSRAPCPVRRCQRLPRSFPRSTSTRANTSSQTPQASSTTRLIERSNRSPQSSLFVLWFLLLDNPLLPLSVSFPYLYPSCIFISSTFFASTVLLPVPLFPWLRPSRSYNTTVFTIQYKTQLSSQQSFGLVPRSLTIASSTVPFSLLPSCFITPPFRVNPPCYVSLLSARHLAFYFLPLCLLIILFCSFFF